MVSRPLRKKVFNKQDGLLMSTSFLKWDMTSMVEGTERNRSRVHNIGQMCFTIAGARAPGGLVLSDLASGIGKNKRGASSTLVLMESAQSE